MTWAHSVWLAPGLTRPGPGLTVCGLHLGSHDLDLGLTVCGLHLGSHDLDLGSQFVACMVQSLQNKKTVAKMSLEELVV